MFLFLTCIKLPQIWDPILIEHNWHKDTLWMDFNFVLFVLVCLD